MKKEKEIEIDYLKKSASTTDCTGLIPSLPQDDAELESYEELYDFLPPHEKVTTKATVK